MAKVSGLGGVITIADSTGTNQVLSGSNSDDITNFSLTTPRGVQETTGINKSAIERLLLLADTSVTLNGVFNSSVISGFGASHEVFATVPSTSVARASIFSVTSTTSPKLTGNIYYSDYQITRANTGELTWQVPGALADGAVPTWS